MQAAITHILPAVTVRRERLMPTRGRIIARRGQKVSPLDVVAEAVLRPEHLLLDIGRGLGLSAEDAEHYIQRRAGDEVDEGDVIAGPVGIGRRVVRAPSPGRIILAGNGQVLMELEGEFSELKAGYSGVVTEILGDRGVVIEVFGSLIQGVWGNGRINYGLLNIISHAADETVTPDMMEVSLRGAVILGGYCEDEKVLLSAAELPIRGMILASMDSGLVDTALNVEYPIVLVEGFGRLPMNQGAFSILADSALREVALNAEPWDRIGDSRPEIMVSAVERSSGQVVPDGAAFGVGQTVRVVSSSHKGKVGRLISLPMGLTVLPSGLRAQSAQVRLSDDDTIQVPLANLEVIG